MHHCECAHADAAAAYCVPAIRMFPSLDTFNFDSYARGLVCSQQWVARCTWRKPLSGHCSMLSVARNATQPPWLARASGGRGAQPFMLDVILEQRNTSAYSVALALASLHAPWTLLLSDPL